MNIGASLPNPGGKQQAEQAAPDAASGPSRGVQSNALGWVVRVAGPLVAGAGVAVLGSLNKLTEAGVARVSAVVLLWYSGWFWLRLITHVKLDYRSRETARERRTAPERKLARMVILEVPIALVFVASGPHVWLMATQPSAGDRTFGIGLGLLVVVAAHSAVLAHYVERAGKSRGSECAHLCKIVRRLIEGAKRLHLERVTKEFMHKTAVTTVSATIVWTLLGLSSVVAMNAPAVVPEALQLADAPQAFELRAVAPADDEGGKARSPDKTSIKKPQGGGQKGDQGAAPSAKEQREPEPAPTYETLCGAGRTPGAEAPEPQKTAIFDAWFGPGAIFAGCANRSHRVHPDGVWISAGTCAGRLRSVAVADASGVGAILFGGPARFALRLAKRKQLLRSTGRTTAGSGDFYAITTTKGVYVWLRRQISDGSGGFETTPRACQDVHDDPVKYLRVPPALVRLWVAQMASIGHWLWPVLTSESDIIKRYRFVADDPAFGSVIRARCSSDTSCDLIGDGVSTSTRGRGGIDVQQVLNLAPDATG